MERLRKSVKKMNKALRETSNKRAKLSSSGNKDGLFLSNSEKCESNYPSNSIGGEGKQAQAATKQTGNQIEPSSRPRHMSERVMGEGARKLSPEKMAALEIDIFKPLDFYEILFDRLKESDKERIISHINEL